MNNKKVCALVVTYNRSTYLLNVLTALKEQTYPLSALLIFDNCSTDNTQELLEKNGYICNPAAGQMCKLEQNGMTVYYYKNTENSGGAGGFCNGMKLAVELDADYLWTMDDDVLPAPDCLSKMMEYMSEDVGVCVPCRTDERYQDYAVTHFDLSNPLLYTIRSRKTMIRSQDIEGETIAICDMPFEGPLMSRDVIAQTGFPREELFIIFDDTEYAHRLSHNTKILYCKKAILHRQIVMAQQGRQLTNWKNYYGYRNQFWFDKTYGRNILVRYLRPFLLLMDQTLRAVVTGRFSNAKVILKAYCDGMHGKLGKTIEPGTPGSSF